MSSPWKKRSERFVKLLSKTKGQVIESSSAEAFIPERHFEGLVGSAMAKSEVRDAIMAGANESDCWEEYLPQAIWGVGIEDVMVIRAESYLGKVFNGTFPKDKKVIIDGDLQIASLHSDKPDLVNLPHMVVRGCLEIYNAPQLESISCMCTGWLTVHECPQLKRLQGEVFRVTSLREVGLGKLGADFRCGGNLVASGCPNLELVNCEAAGGITLIGCGLVRTGAALHTEGNLQISHCPKLKKLEGYVGGEVKISNERTGTIRDLPAPDCSGLRAGKITLPDTNSTKLKKGTGGAAVGGGVGQGGGRGR
jgi:hypothetical protein